jgi:serine/threonine protein kinase
MVVGAVLVMAAGLSLPRTRNVAAGVLIGMVPATTWALWVVVNDWTTPYFENLGPAVPLDLAGHVLLLIAAALAFHAVRRAGPVELTFLRGPDRVRWALIPDMRERFRCEVSAAQLARGDHIAELVAADMDAAPAWLATEYVPGPSLAEAIASHGPLPLSAATLAIAGVAQALTVTHQAGLVHRDLNPGNVLLLEDGPRIIDFGIARLADAATQATVTPAARRRMHRPGHRQRLWTVRS